MEPSITAKKYYDYALDTASRRRAERALSRGIIWQENGFGAVVIPACQLGIRWLNEKRVSNLHHSYCHQVRGDHLGQSWGSSQRKTPRSAASPRLTRGKKLKRVGQKYLEGGNLQRISARSLFQGICTETERKWHKHLSQKYRQCKFTLPDPKRKSSRKSVVSAPGLVPKSLLRYLSGLNTSGSSNKSEISTLDLSPSFECQEPTYPGRG